MKHYAVAEMNFYDNYLEIKFTEAENWKEALNNCFYLGEGEEKYILPDDLDEAKFEAFNGDFLFDVKEIPA